MHGGKEDKPAPHYLEDLRRNWYGISNRNIKLERQVRVDCYKLSSTTNYTVPNVGPPKSQFGGSSK
uniref:Uncharacterized protein n=1 Tax=Oryza sativa subsp. japonica TaxID=39947 RepID=Q6ZIX6_ORYSJ|nr:hypothetical protein [Oryza sativa Japonica Group]